MKAKELIKLLEQYPNADVVIVKGEDEAFDIVEEKVYFNEDSFTGEMFIDIDIA